MVKTGKLNESTGRVRGAWDLEAMSAAVEAVRNKTLSIRNAAASFGVPKSTLERHVNQKIKVPGSLGGRRPILDDQYEQELASHVLDMQRRFYCLTPKELRRLAFTLAERNNLVHPFSRKTESAGYCWLTSFLHRHKQLSIRKPEATSLTRAVGFNKVQVSRFFDLLKEEMQKYKFTPHCIWNTDESGLTCVHRPGKIIATKGQKQVGKITSGERGKTITIMCTMNAV